MTQDEYFASLDSKLSELIKMDWLREPVQDTHAQMVKQIFTNGEDENGTKDKYKEGSYKEYRRKRGRQVGYVDLILEGDLFRDFSTTVVKIGNSWVTGVKRPINANKIDGMINLYGDRKFKLQEKEKEEFVKRVRAKILSILQ